MSAPSALLGSGRGVPYRDAEAEQRLGRRGVSVAYSFLRSVASGLTVASNFRGGSALAEQEESFRSASGDSLWSVTSAANAPLRRSRRGATRRENLAL